MLDKIDREQADSLLIEYYGHLLKTYDSTPAHCAGFIGEAHRQQFSEEMLNYLNRGFDDLEIMLGRHALRT